MKNPMIELANSLKYDANWSRFNYTNAYISDTKYSEDGKAYILIKSYNTVVGLVDVKEQKAYEFGKYSPTTSKQFTQICNQIFKGFERVFINETNW